MRELWGASYINRCYSVRIIGARRDSGEVLDCLNPGQLAGAGSGRREQITTEGKKLPVRAEVEGHVSNPSSHS